MKKNKPFIGLFYSSLKKILKSISIAFILLNIGILQTSAITAIDHSTEVPEPQQRAVSGTVIDENNDPMVGVNVLIEGTTTGALTDIDGKYSLVIPNDNVIIVFSFIGYTTERVSVSGKTTIDVQLNPDLLSLDEIVVIGYGTQRKQDITGSVSVVNVEQLQSRAASNFGSQLQGEAAGVVVGTQGAPGSSTMIRIRGIGTVNNNGPLYVIDGVSTTNQDLNSINPNDIETIQILKDASSASIYGAQASNGVIIITTKKGKIGTPKITYDAYYSVSSPTSYYDILDSRDWADLWWKARLNAADIRGTGVLPSHPQFGSGLTPVYHKYIIPTASDGPFTIADWAEDNRISEFSEGTDWYGLSTGNAGTQSHQMTISGGSESNQFLVGLNYFNQQGTFLHTYYERYSARINTQSNIRKWLRIGENLNISFSNQNRSESQGEGNALTTPYLITPFIPLYDIAGNYAGSKAQGSGNRRNPVATLDRAKDNLNTGLRMLGNIFGEVDIMPDLTFRTSFGIDHSRGWNYGMSKLEPEFSETSGRNQFSEGASFGYRYVFTNTINYELNINGVHNIKALIGSEYIKDGIGRSLNGSRYDYLFENDINTWTLDNGGTNNLSNSSDWRGETAMFGLFGRVDYSYNNRYLLTGIIRRDGSSRFSESNRYGMFPSISAGWRVSEENFMQDLVWMDDLKFRIGYGVTGNSEIPRTTNWANEYVTDPRNTNYDLDGTQGSAHTGFGLSNFGNADTRWETTRMTNVGFDMVLFKGKLETNIEYYVKRTSDMLVRDSYSAIAGSGTPPYVNLGKIENKGWDFSVIHRNEIGKIGYSVGVNISTYKNNVVKLNDDVNAQFWGGGTRYGNVTLTEQGSPISQFYGYSTIGFYESVSDVTSYKGVTGDRAGQTVLPLGVGTDAELIPEQQIGKWIFEDINGDGRVNSEDKHAIGSPHPDFTGGMNLGLEYGNFELTTFFYFCVGNDIYNQNRWWLDFQSQDGNRSTTMRDRSWEPGKTDALLPILDAGDIISNSAPNTYLVEDGSYIRLQNLNLSYTIPKQFINRIGVDNLKFYIQGVNLFTLTKYTGLDPDITNQSLGTSGDLTKGMDYGKWPSPKQFLIGVNMAF